eukprot:scaffold1609_cov91-Cylindrotheca_fusiformis.AAC.2
MPSSNDEQQQQQQESSASSSSNLLKSSLQAGTSLDATERVFTVTSDNIPIPHGHLRKEMRLQNLWHRATFIVVEYQNNNNNTTKNQDQEDDNDEKYYLVQKRSQFKDFGPGLLDGSPGGVLGYGESYWDNATRELKEETGIDVTVDGKMERILDFSHQDDRVKVFGELFKVTYDGSLDDLKLQEEEVEEIIVMSESEIKQRIQTSPEDFISDSLCAMKLFFLS